MLVLDRSLNWLRHRYADVPTAIVYIPSPLSLYHFAGGDVSYCSIPVSHSSADKIARNSDFISSLVQKSATNQGIDFIDPRPSLRALAATTVIHGPKDWDHFNEAGYRALGALVANYVRPRH
jgi:predicted choloylglycine hydrolase